MAKVHKVYEPEFKEMVVCLVLEEGRTIKSVNEEYSLGERPFEAGSDSSRKNAHPIQKNKI